MSMDVEALSKALTGFGAGRTVRFSEAKGMTLYDIESLEVIGEDLVLFPALDERESQP